MIKKAHVAAPEGTGGFTVMAGLTEQAALDLTKEVEMVGAFYFLDSHTVSKVTEPEWGSYRCPFQACQDLSNLFTA